MIFKNISGFSMNKLVAIPLYALMLSFSGFAYSDDVDKAYSVCAVFNNTGMLSEPCEVSGWDGAVDVTLDTSGAEARKVCRGVAQMLSQQGVFFNERQWKIRIYSPFSDGNTLAVCNLPSE